MIGYNPPTVDDPIKQLPNSRIVKNIRDNSQEDIGNQFIIEFQGPKEELENTKLVVAAANSWMARENLLGFFLKYPIDSAHKLKGCNGVYIRQIKYIDPK